MSPLPAALLELFNQEFSYEPAVGPDDYNTLSYGAAVTGVPCYIQRSSKRALDKSGREVISHVQIFVGNPDITIGDNDRITLPDGSQPPIIEVLGAPDEEGNPYWLEIRA